MMEWLRRILCSGASEDVYLARFEQQAKESELIQDIVQEQDAMHGELREIHDRIMRLRENDASTDTQ